MYSICIPRKQHSTCTFVLKLHSRVAKPESAVRDKQSLRRETIVTNHSQQYFKVT